MFKLHMIVYKTTISFILVKVYCDNTQCKKWTPVLHYNPYLKGQRDQSMYFVARGNDYTLMIICKVPVNTNYKMNVT